MGDIRARPGSAKHIIGGREAIGVEGLDRASERRNVGLSCLMPAPQLPCGIMQRVKRLEMAEARRPVGNAGVAYRSEIASGRVAEAERKPKRRRRSKASA